MFWFIFACMHKPFITEDNVQPIAEETMKVAHPTAQLVGSELLGISNSKKTGRYADIKMFYKPMMQERSALTVRYYIMSTEPCKINLEVLSDTGNIPPVLLNEWAAEPKLSQYICANFQEK